MDEPQPIAPAVVVPGGQKGLVFYVDYRPRYLQGFGVTGTELEMLRSSYSSKNQLFFGFTGGVAMSALFALAAGTFSTAMFALIGAVGFAAGVMAVNFFLRMRDDDQKAGSIIDEIRQRPAVAVADPTLTQEQA